MNLATARRFGEEGTARQHNLGVPNRSRSGSAPHAIELENRSGSERRPSALWRRIRKECIAKVVSRLLSFEPEAEAIMLAKTTPVLRRIGVGMLEGKDRSGKI